MKDPIINELILFEFIFKDSINKMNLVNVALENLGAGIKTYSSCLDSLQQASNILHQAQGSLWATSQGLPQFVIISLEGLNVKFRNILQIGFMLWHDYQTNPKTIQLWVAQTTDQEFSFWAQFQLHQKKGIQLYQVKPLTQKYIYLKVSVTETYGAFQTYLNQVYFMAQGVTAAKNQKRGTQKETVPRKKQLDLQDLQSNLNSLIQVDRRISQEKSSKKQKVLNNRVRQDQLSRKQQKARSKKQIIIQKQQISKGSLSSNRAGLSIYYHQDSHLPQSPSNPHTSSHYHSSSQNDSQAFGIREKVDNKLQSDQSIHSNNAALTPSLNFNRKSIHSLHHKPITQIQFSAGKLMQASHKNVGKQERPDEDSMQEDEQQSQNYDDEEIQEQNEKEQDADAYQQQSSSNLSENTPKYKEQQSQPYLQQQLSDDYNYNATMLALSKHAVKLQDNMELIQRKVQVLDLKVSHSHQKIRQDILSTVQNKLQQIVERKLRKILSSQNPLRIVSRNSVQKSSKIGKRVKNQTQVNELQTNLQPPSNQINYKKNLTKQFFKNDYGQLQQNQASRDKARTKRQNKEQIIEQGDRNQPQSRQQQAQRTEKMNRLKKSKSFAHVPDKARLQGDQVNQNYNNQKLQKNKQPNQQYIATLLQRLNHKLKQRQVKLHKIRKKQQQRLKGNQIRKDDFPQKVYLARNQGDQRQDKLKLKYSSKKQNKHDYHRRVTTADQYYQHF